MTHARITGTGSYLPEEVITNKDLEAFCDTTDEWIRKRTGIEQRHKAASGQGTSDLALHAAQDALADAGMSPEEVELLIVCTVTPDQMFPASANLLQGKLGAVNAASFDINAACSGFMTGLSTADAFIRAGRYKKILLIGAEIQSSRMTWKNRDTAILFGDGAGAVVIEAQETDSGVLTTHLGSDGKNYEILHLPRGGSRDYYTKENFDDDAYTIYMKGPELFKRAVIKFAEVAQEALDATGLTMDDIALFVPHQANARIIEAAGERMGIAPEKVMVNIQHTGNTTAASIPIALHEAKEAGRIKEGDYVMLASFGAGLTWGASIIKW
ncbi:MAG: 3-oxoacyl-ACP synthase [Candidatus Hydrogenedentota bacterium]|nr:MAG: 3-oxoacyl-ACP synthase [Candidatus Hydrogenedentota bacterium]